MSDQIVIPGNTYDATIRFHQSAAVTMQGFDHFYQWLDSEQISFAFTTYQANRLFLVGRKENGHLGS